MSGSLTPLEQSRRLGCALLRACAVAGTHPGHQHPGRSTVGAEQRLCLHPCAAASSSLPCSRGSPRRQARLWGAFHSASELGQATPATEFI